MSADWTTGPFDPIVKTDALLLSTTDYSAPRAGRSVDECAVDETMEAILASRLEPQACARMLADVNLLRMFTSGLSELVGETDDGGLTLEIAELESGREIVLAVPVDGSARYFIARDREGLREAGHVLGGTGLVSLARWVRGTHDEVGSVGLAMG